MTTVKREVGSATEEAGAWAMLLLEQGRLGTYALFGQLSLSPSGPGTTTTRPRISQVINTFINMMNIFCFVALGQFPLKKKKKNR